MLAEPYIKCGTLREEGYIFSGWATVKGKQYPVWRSPDSHARWLAHNKAKQKALRVATMTPEQREARRRSAVKSRVTNQSKIAARRKSRYAVHGDILRAKSLAWQKKNWAKVLESRRKPQYAIASSLRTRVCAAVKAQRSKKSASTEKLVGCSLLELRGYLQALFEQGMTWENHGEWHIDHIIPCASFDLTRSENQRECFHYTNLQPLWASENMSKGCKVPQSCLKP